MTGNAISTTISNDSLDALRATVGVPRERTYQEWEFDDARVSRSQVRHWAVVLGDMRPIFVDAEYAATGPWGALIAPPSVLACFEQIDPEIDGLPGCQAVLESASLEWFQPIRVGDFLLPRSTIESLEDICSDDGRAVTMSIATSVSTADGAPVGRCTLRWRCVERGTRVQGVLFGQREEPYMWTKAGIDALRDEYAAEQPRGAAILHWEDANEGDLLAHVLKGPTTRPKYLGRMVPNWYWGQLQGWEAHDAHPELFFANENDAPEPIAATDWGHHRAQRWGGVPGALDSNVERIHYVSHLLLNWAGDHGFISRMDLEFHRHNMVGDVTRSYGRVAAKRRQDGRGIITLDIWQENQLGEQVTTGTAEVALPLRS
ncbi:MAG: MaoC family dehydratase N-terminal domain-containing protein [Thermoflexaceae bacterium]|nr:MaoC family dehydratase N-terminal domain-containing protein [Thermoflexaceae bacterium]